MCEKAMYLWPTCRTNLSLLLLWGEVPLTAGEKKNFSPGQFSKFQFSRHPEHRVSGKLVGLGVVERGWSCMLATIT